MFVHVPAADDVHGGVAALLRLGPLLPVLFAIVVAAVARLWPRRSMRIATGAVASATAGAVHLALVPGHYATAPAVGVLFGLAGVVQVAVALGMLISPGRRWWPGLLTLIAIAFTVTFAAARAATLPVFGRPEDVDALGLITTALAVLAAACWLPVTARARWLADVRLVPVNVTVAVLAAPIVSGVGPTLVDTVVVAAVATGLSAFGGVEHGRLVWVVADAAVLALVLRGPIVGSVLAGAALGVLHAITAERRVRWLVPASGAIAVTLAIPMLDVRLDLLHVGHPDDVTAAVALFVFAGLIAATAVVRRRIGALVLAYGLLAVVELARFWAGATGTGAAEVFVTSLTLFVLVVPPLLDTAPTGRGDTRLAVGAAVGASVGVLRLARVAYPIPWGVLLGAAVAAGASAALRGRRRPAAPRRMGRASATTPGGT